MALSITKFEDAFDYKIVRETVCNNTAIVNVTSEPGSIYSISLKNSTSSAAYFKFFDLSSVIMGSSVDANTTTVYNIPDGYPFTNISFACTLNQNPVDNTALTANNNETVDVKIVCS